MADGQVGEAFDALVAATDPAMVVVTTASGHERDGCLVGFHSQSSIDPARYVVWLSVQNRTYRLALGATHLAVHLLGEADGPLAARFGGETGDQVDKLAGLDWTPGPGGVPLLADLPRHFVGRILTRLEPPTSDHVAFTLEPQSAHAPDLGSPLRLHHTHHIDPGHEA